MLHCVITIPRAIVMDRSDGRIKLCVVSSFTYPSFGDTRRHGRFQLAIAGNAFQRCRSGDQAGHIRCEDEINQLRGVEQPLPQDRTSRALIYQ